MPRPRFRKLSAEKQQQILEVAKGEFAENGFDGASYNRIIDKAGLSKGAMYYYFDDKTDLYATVLEDVQTAMLAFVGPVDFERFWPGVEVFIRKAIVFSQEHPELAALARSLGEVQRRSEGPIAELYERSREFIRATIEEGQRRGAVRTDIPKPLLVNIAFAMGEAIDFWLLEQFGEFAVDGDVDETVRMLMRLWRDLAQPKEE